MWWGLGKNALWTHEDRNAHEDDRLEHAFRWRLSSRTDGRESQPLDGVVVTRQPEQWRSSAGSAEDCNQLDPTVIPTWNGWRSPSGAACGSKPRRRSQTPRGRPVAVALKGGQGSKPRSHRAWGVSSMRLRSSSGAAKDRNGTQAEDLGHAFFALAVAPEATEDRSNAWMDWCSPSGTLLCGRAGLAGALPRDRDPDGSRVPDNRWRSPIGAAKDRNATLFWLGYIPPACDGRLRNGRGSRRNVVDDAQVRHAP